MTDTLTRPGLAPPPADPPRRRAPAGPRWWRAPLKHAVLILFGFTMLYPLLWMVASAFKPDELIFREPGLIPTQLDFGNFTDGWNALPEPFNRYRG